jgi:hypothetical protein
MEKPTQISEDNIIKEVSISKTDIAEFARDSYEYESGRRKAIDEGVMTMEEFEIYHFINAWINQNVPFSADQSPEEYDKSYRATHEKAFLKAISEYSIDENTARQIFEKVRKIPKVAPKS